MFKTEINSIIGSLFIAITMLIISSVLVQFGFFLGLFEPESVSGESCKNASLSVLKSILLILPILIVIVMIHQIYADYRD
jgi:hypothetical protein